MKKLLLILAALVLQACASTPSVETPEDTKAQVKTKAKVSSSEVVVIGKIELVPPINAEMEQRTHWNQLGERRMLTRMFMSTGPVYKPVEHGAMNRSDFKDSIEPEWGVPFMAELPRRRTFLNGGVTYLNVVQQELLWFPGGFYFDVPADAAAVYIGTLRFHRNDFNTITKVEVIDERGDIAVVLKKEGGKPMQVRPSLLKRVR